MWLLSCKGSVWSAGPPRTAPDLQRSPCCRAQLCQQSGLQVVPGILQRHDTHSASLLAATQRGLAHRCSEMTVAASVEFQQVPAADARMIGLGGVLRLAVIRAADLCRSCLISSTLRCTSIWAVLNRLEMLRVNVSLSFA